MRTYLIRWLLACFVVAPVVCLVVAVVDLHFFGISGPHAADPLWDQFLGMIGFYGGYAIIAATALTAADTWLSTRFASTGLGRVGWATGLGILVLLPQGAAFGLSYLLPNAVAGAFAGLLYGLLARTTITRRT